MDGKQPSWVVSPHLLVAQAVAAALRSVGTPAQAHSWEFAVRSWDPADPDRPEHLVAIMDGLDRSDVLDDVGNLVQSGATRIVIVTSRQAAIWWGGLLEGDTVDLTTATSVRQLAEVVERVRSGDSSLDAASRAALRTSWSKAIDRRRELTALIDSLSPQQRRVLQFLASGRRVSEVGVVMGVQRGTVRSHVKALRAKLGARTQLEAVAMLREVYAEGVGADLVPRPRQVIEEPAARVPR